MKDFKDYYCPDCYSNLGSGWVGRSCPVCGHVIDDDFFDEDDDYEE